MHVQHAEVAAGLARLRTWVAAVPATLATVSDAEAAARPAPGKWSRKEELGHLIDAAAHTHLRLVCAQLAEAPTLPAYAANDWVRLHAYQTREWIDIIVAWQAFTTHLLGVIEAMPDDAWARAVRVGDDDPTPLTMVLTRYLDHAAHHLEHLGTAIP